ncbi:hypothetical protein DFJ73DRAFT_857489 [Zopfochytrium polystomum]|nr:hypothetical protein DFJ73DRAFT_857489 [Zopfochytrium polystomum]
MFSSLFLFFSFLFFFFFFWNRPRLCGWFVCMCVPVLPRSQCFFLQRIGGREGREKRTKPEVWGTESGWVREAGRMEKRWQRERRAY